MIRLPRSLPLILALVALGWALWASPTLTEIAAGVAVFLFGMMALEQGFKAFTGGTLERLLQVSTDRLWKGLAFGAVATTLTQSSTLVSVITISFLSAGLMGLSQGIAVIFGANLGTTTGAWLVAGFGLRVDISVYAMPLLVFGTVLVLNRQRMVQGVGYVVAGIGFLFLGIHFMKEGFETFQATLDLNQYAVPGLRGLLIYAAFGLLATVVMQSSHATLILTLTALGAGQITYDNALALSIGANVGTTVTALIGAINANINGRRLAGAHFIFNVFTGLVALVFLQGFLWAVDGLALWLGIAADNFTLKLALFHTLFNLAGIALMVPLIPRLVLELETRLKPKPVKLDEMAYISEAALRTPAGAIEASRKELLRLFRRVFSVISEAVMLEPAQLRRAEHPEQLQAVPQTLRAVDLEALYRSRIKPLHGAIVDVLARLSPEGARVQQLLLLRQASQHLVQAVKDCKHLQKNMVPALRSANPTQRNAYLSLRLQLATLLKTLDQLAEEPPEDSAELELILSELNSDLEADNIANSQPLDEWIRERGISAEQATSLMNDQAYTYRISRGLIKVAEAIFLPFRELDEALRDAMTLAPDEVADVLASQDKP